MLGIPERGDSLREYGERRNVPDDETAAADEGSAGEGARALQARRSSPPPVGILTQTSGIPPRRST